MDDATWTAFMLVLTALLGAAAWLGWRRRGAGTGLTLAGIAMLPLAAYLTETLRRFVQIGNAIGSWATGLALSPRVWAGIVVAGVGVLLFLAGRTISARSAGHSAPRAPRRELPAQQTSRAAATERQRGRGKAAPDDDLADIEALLRDRGIS